MLKSSSPVNAKDIQPLIQQLAETLCLYHWRIKHRIEEDRKLGDSLMKVIPNRDRNIATIFIRKSLVGKPLSEFGPLVLHELMHVVIDPVVEEHGLQLQYEVPEARFQEYQKRFLRPLEKVVEHLTTQIAPLIVCSTEQLESKIDLRTDQLEAVALKNQELLQSILDRLQFLDGDNRGD